jgi:integrase
MSNPTFPVEIKAGGNTIRILRSDVRIEKKPTESSPNKNSKPAVEVYESYIVEHYEGNKRVRERRRNYKEALTRANEIKTKLLNQDVESLRLTGHDRRTFLAVVENLRVCGVSAEHATKEYADAFKELAPLNLKVLEAVQTFVKSVHRLNGTPLETAIAFYERHGRKILTARKVPEIIAELVKAKEEDHKGAYHVRDLETRLGRFAEAFPGNILDITSNQIDVWLRSLRSRSKNQKDDQIIEIVGKTRNNYRNAVVQLFNFAKDKNYLPNDLPTAAKPTQRVTEEPSENEIFTPKEMAELLNFVPAHLIPSMVIKAFSGVRTEEVSKIEWEMIRFRQDCIVLPAKITKLTQRRTIALKPNLKAWLEPFKSLTGRICTRWSTPQGIFQAWKRYADKKGIQIGGNRFRNSYISFRLAEKRDIQLVALESGNSPEVIQREYLELAPPEDAEKWFAIMPSTAKKQELRCHIQELRETQRFLESTSTDQPVSL